MRPEQPRATDGKMLVGIMLLAIAIIITIVIKHPSKMQYFIIYALVGLSFALILPKSAENSSLTIKRLNRSLRLVGGVVLPIFLILTNPVEKYESDIPRQSVTVFVHGKKGLQDMILRQKGYVIMDIGSERKRSPISENGDAYFQNLQIGDIVRLNIDFSEPYKSINPDTLYTIDEEGRIYLAVYLQGIDNIPGNVLDGDQPLKGVIVKMNSLSTTTDSTGNFFINIPDSLQTKEYTVWFFKQGFKSLSKEVHPQTGIHLSIVMERLPTH